MKRLTVWMGFMLVLCSIAGATTNEIAIQVSLQVNKSSLNVQRTPPVVYAQMAGTRFNSIVISTHTGGWAYASSGSVVTPGECYLRNLDISNSVAVSFDVGVTTNLLLLPGEPDLFRLAPTFTVTNMGFRTAPGGVSTNADLEMTLIEN